METPSAAIDQAVFREVLGHYPTGVAVVTGIDPEGKVQAMVVGSFTSVSLEPPLIGFLPRKGSTSYDQLRRCETLCVNILTAEQEQQGRAIVSRYEDKLAGIDWFRSERGTPVLKDSLAWIDVTIVDELEAGDHWFTLCAVQELQVQNPTTPLLFFQGGYGSFVVPSLVARMHTDVREFIAEAAEVRPHLEVLARKVGGVAQLLAAVNRDELMAVVSAAAGGHNAGEGLGEHVPMIPPIGDTTIAHGTSEDVDYWLGKAKSAPPALLDVCRRRLDFCRQHGYLISWLPPGDREGYTRMREAARQFAEGHLTPAQEREVQQAITSSGIEYEPREIREGETCDIASIVAPVLDRDGAAKYTVRIEQLPRGVDWETAAFWVRLVRETASAIETKILGE